MDLTLLLIAGLLIGLSLSSIPALSQLIPPLLFGFTDDPRTAIGSLLPILLLGDCFTLYLRRNRIAFSTIKWFMPGIIIGICTGYFLMGKLQSPFLFRQVALTVMGIPIIMQLFQHSLGKVRWQQAPLALHCVSVSTSLCAVLGHLGGPILNTYLLGRMRTPALHISTYSALFLLINGLKIPLYFSFGFINSQSLMQTASAALTVLLGCWLGHTTLPFFNKQKFQQVMSFALIAGWLLAWLHI